RRARGEVRGGRMAELGRSPVELERDGVGRVRRDARSDPVGEKTRYALTSGRKALERGCRIGPEDLEIHGRAQTEIRAGDGGSTAVAAVADRRDPRRQALGGAETGDVDVLVPADARLPLDVQRDPLGEVAEAVAEAGVDGVLDVRVGVHEARE